MVGTGIATAAEKALTGTHDPALLAEAPAAAAAAAAGAGAGAGAGAAAPGAVLSAVQLAEAAAAAAAGGMPPLEVVAPPADGM